MAVHFVVVAVALFSVAFAARFPETSPASGTGLNTPTFALSGITGGESGRAVTYFRPGTSQQTRESVAAIITTNEVESVRAAGGVSPVSAFSSGVAAAAATGTEQGAGIQPLADIVDPLKPFVLYTAQPGDSPAYIAERFGIEAGTLLDNNPTIEGDLLLVGQEVVVPRKDGILYKVGFGDTVDSIVAQYDNITSGTVVDYRPNAITDPKSLESGRYLLLVGATKKPPPPPEPEPVVPSTPSSGSGSSGGGSTPTGGAPAPGGAGRFNYPLSRWHGVSDPFGTYRGVGRIHEGIDLDLWGMHHSTVFAACTGVVAKVEYLTYSYGYHVIIDCGGGWTTLYAHFDRIDVVAGQQVSGGTPLGISGLTGYTTGEHLHFEIRINGAPVNPANYLGF
ncbi:MAG: M23 family metallopeptidase [Dehalococcoidia bacterium]|nr:M23 family metallopeptidase [Dehalococcoidia bacterium]